MHIKTPQGVTDREWILLAIINSTISLCSNTLESKRNVQLAHLHLVQLAASTLSQTSPEVQESVSTKTWENQASSAQSRTGGPQVSVLVCLDFCLQYQAGLLLSLTPIVVSMLIKESATWKII